SLLDAHPNAIISDEVNALRVLEAGFSKNQLFYLLLRNSRRLAESGRQRTGYTYDIAGQWQGRCDELLVIGDKMGGASATRLRAKPFLLPNLERKLGVKTKLVHVIRNPYDIISTISLRLNFTVEQSSDRFFSLCQAVNEIKTQTNSDVHDLRHEALIADPKGVMKAVCDFLHISSPDAYYEACASIVFKSPHKSRYEVPWTPELINAVKHKMNSFQFLEGYSYHD
ncbi:MAG: sulfotransferase, partial [Gammaproteobacteria bacterium]